MVSQCELINIPANSTVPNFAWNFLPLTVALKMRFHNPGTKVTSAKQRKGLGFDRVPVPLGSFRGQKSNSARLYLTEHRRKEARKLHAGIFPRFNSVYSSTASHESKQSWNCLAWLQTCILPKFLSPGRFQLSFPPVLTSYLIQTIPTFASNSLSTPSQKATSWEA